MIEELKKFVSENSDKKIALFSDMDGVLAELEFDYEDLIHTNGEGHFLTRKPLKRIIDKLNELTIYSNLDFFIISACSFDNQAKDKSMWLRKYAPFFKEDKQIFVVKETVKYTPENKSEIKTEYIDKILKEKKYDFVIYVEDEYLMLRKAHKKLKDKILCIHVTNLID